MLGFASFASLGGCGRAALGLTDSTSALTLSLLTTGDFAGTVVAGADTGAADVALGTLVGAPEETGAGDEAGAGGALVTDVGVAGTDAADATDATDAGHRCP